MKKILLLLLSCCFAVLLQAQVSKTVSCTAGGLSALLTSTEKSSITNLTLTGIIDARDFVTMRDNMPVLAVIDISGVAIVAFTDTQGQLSSQFLTYFANQISQSAFNNKTSLTSIILPSSITSISSISFYGCTGITSIVIPTSVSQIGGQVFYGCTGLTSVTIASSVTEIGMSCFWGCTNLQSISCYSSIPPTLISSTNYGVFDGVNKNTCNLYIPSGSKSAYEAATGWQDFTNIVEMTPAANIVLNKTSISLDLATTISDNITATITPTNATVKWLSSNTAVATVNNGVVTGVGMGTATITCSSLVGNISAACSVTVSNSTPFVLPTSIVISPFGSQTVSVNGVIQLGTTILPATTTNQSVTWISDKPTIASVDQTGKVTGITSGNAVISAISNSVNTIKASCNVTVSLSLSANSTHEDSVYYYWNAHKKLTVDHKPTLITFDFSDTTNLSFTKFWTHSAANGNASLGFYKYSWDAIEKALKIDVDFTIGGTVTPPATNYSAILSYNWLKQVQGINSVSYNPFINSDDSVEGVMLDLTDKNNRVFNINYKALNLGDSAQLRIDLGDANGRVSNNFSPKHTLYPNSNYQDVRFSWDRSDINYNEWNQDMKEMQDGWSSQWQSINTNRSNYNTSNVPGKFIDGLPSLSYGGTGIYNLDTANIGSWDMYFDDGVIASKGTDVVFSVLIKKIQIGVKSAEGTANEYVFGGGNSGFQGNYISLKTINPSVGQMDKTLSYNETSYTVLYPTGTTLVPALIAIPNQVGATVSYQNAANLNDTTKITVSSVDGKITRVYTITFKELIIVLPTSIAISPAGTQTIDIGQTIKLTANVFPVNTTNKMFTWSSSDVSVATVDLNGNVVGKKAGNIILSAISVADPAIRSLCYITVSNSVVSGLNANSTNKDSVEILWNAHKKLTVDHKPTLITFDFSDTTNLSFTKFWTHSAANNNASLAFYKYSWDATEKALKIDIDFTLGGTATPPATNYSAILNYNWLKQVKGFNSVSFNPFINSGDSVEGVMLDLTNKYSRVFNLNYKVVNLRDSAQLRIDLGDANGRVSNNFSPKHTLHPSSSYQDVRFAWDRSDINYNEWNQDMKEMQDGWSSQWQTINTNRYSSVTGGAMVGGLPNLQQGGIGIYNLDTANIGEWDMYFDDGLIASQGTDVTFSVYINKIQIGDPAAQGTADEYVFGGAKSGFQGNSISLNTLNFSYGTPNTTSLYKDSVIIVYLPAGSTAVPTITAAANKPDATITITNAITIADTTKIIVKSVDGTISKTYTIIYKIKSNDATLKSLSLNNGLLAPVFSSSSFIYNVNLPVGTTSVPTITALVNNSGAKFVIANTARIPGTSTVSVTAQDGTTKTYTINFYTGTLKEISFILPRFIIFENENLNIGACVYTFNNVIIRFKIVDQSIATVNNQSLLTGIKSGTTKIYAMNVNDSTEMDSATVLVIPNITFESATVSAGGTLIEVTVNGNLPLYSGIESDFSVNTVLKAGTSYTVLHVMKKVGSPNVLLLELDKPLAANQTLTINYAPISATTATSEARSFTITNTTAVDEIKIVSANVYPNPAETSITVEANELQLVKIFNLQGKEMLSQETVGDKAIISVQELPAGLYFVQLITPSQTMRKAFVKR
jgi:uncharacterized protein YjdB